MMWKTTPVRVKQVPQDSTEWDTDTNDENGYGA